MTNQEIIQKLLAAKKGAYTKITKVKDLGDGVIKESDMVIRLGVNYKNLAINANRSTGSLPWGHWVEGLENLVIEHKGHFYVRLTSKTPENPDGADVVETRYFHNGERVEKAQVIKLIGAEKSSANVVYSVKFENIKSIQVKQQ